MTTHTIDTPEAARKAADEIVTLLTAISEKKAAQETEKNAIDTRYAAIVEPLDARREALQKELQKYLRSTAARKALFKPGCRSGESALATFGYYDTPPKLAALKGKLEDVARALYKAGRTEYLTVPEPKVAINEGKIKEAALGDGALADLGLRWRFATKFYVQPRNKEITGAARAND